MDDDRWDCIHRTVEYLTNQQASSEAKFSAWNDRAQARMEELLHVQEGNPVLIDALFASQDRTHEKLNALIGFVDRDNH